MATVGRTQSPRSDFGSSESAEGHQASSTAMTFLPGSVAICGFTFVFLVSFVGYYSGLSACQAE